MHVERNVLCLHLKATRLNTYFPCILQDGRNLVNAKNVVHNKKVDFFRQSAVWVMFFDISDPCLLGENMW